MNKPDDVSQEAWDASKEAIEPWLGPTHQYRIDCQEEIARAIMAARLQEREECAKVADADNGLAVGGGGNYDYGPNVSRRIAQAIRNRK